MKRYLPLLRYARPHGKDLVVILTMMLLSVGLSVLQPWPLAIFVDYVLGDKTLSVETASRLTWLPGSTTERELLVLVVLATIAIAICLSLLSYIKTMATVRFNQRVTYDLGADLFQHLQSLSVRYFNHHTVGDSIARVTLDPYCVQILVTSAILPVVQSLISLIIMFLIMWRIEPTLTLVSLTVVPFQILTIRFLAGPMKRRVRLRRDLETQMFARVEQVLSVLPAVQAFSRERREVENFRGEAMSTADAYSHATRAEVAFGELTRFVTVLGSAAILLIGGLYALDGRMSTGAILLFIAYLNSLYAPLNAITYTAATVQAAAANADRVLEVLDTEPDVIEAPDAVHAELAGAIEIRNVTFGYEDDRPVLHDISLIADPGEVVAIVGPSGAGKSSLVNLLPRFLDPWQGSIAIDGWDIRELTLESLRSQIAIVMQDPFLMPVTVAENIRYGRPDASLAEVIEAAKAASADDFIAQLPAGYETILGERGIGLSGGERQRLAIARAFLKNAPVLILDEPTSALDAKTESALLGALDRLMKHRTTLVIAHRLSTSRNADRIVVLEDGQIVEQGRHAELIQREGAYAMLYFHQMQTAAHDDSWSKPLHSTSGC